MPANDAGFRAAGVSCGGEHTLFLDMLGRVFSAGACGLGWEGTMPGAMDHATLVNRSNLRPCPAYLDLAAFTAAATSSIAKGINNTRGADKAEGGSMPTCSSGGPGADDLPTNPMPRIAKVVGGYYHRYVYSRYCTDR